MPLLHKASKAKLRSAEPSTPDQSTTPPMSSEGFKSFFKKRTPSSISTSSPRTQIYGYTGSSTVPPRPILRPPPISSPSRIQPNEHKPVSPTSIRFAGMGGMSGNSASSPVVATAAASRPSMSPPRVVVTTDTATPPMLPSQAIHAYQTYQQSSPSSSPVYRRPSSSLPPPTVTRRSSRPISPAASSFGARQRSSPSSTTSSATSPPSYRRSASPASPASSLSSASSASSSPYSPVRTAKQLDEGQVQDIFTPPSAHSQTIPSQTPKSPYRPTTTRSPGQGVETGAVSRLPDRTSSLFSGTPRISTPGTPVSVFAARVDDGVPMLNLIPATPQDDNDDFKAIEHPSGSEEREVEAAAPIEEVEVEEEAEEAPVIQMATVEKVELAGSESIEDVAAAASLADIAVRRLEQMEASSLSDYSKPQLDLSFDFSPFAPLDLRPSSPIDLSFDYENEQNENQESAASSPYDYYPSLPSLSALDADSCESSEEDHTLNSFPDVEEALGSMLASLSDVRLSDLPDLPDMPHLPALPPTPKMGDGGMSAEERNGDVNCGLGFGLGLGLEIANGMSTVSSPGTAPLTPRRRRPPPLDLSRSTSSTKSSKSIFTPFARLPPAGGSSSEGDFVARQTKIAPAPTSAPLYNHRNGFYRSYPNSCASSIATASTGTSTSSGPILVPIPPITDANKSSGPVSASTFGSRTPGTFDHLGSLPSFGTFKVDSWDLPSEQRHLGDEYAYEYDGHVGHKRTGSAGDSIATTVSDASDDDLHTASIISLTPILASNGRIAKRQDIVETEVGVAF